MAFLKIRNNIYYACWYDSTGKKIVRSTKIPTDHQAKPGAPRESKQALKKKAEQLAALMERTDKDGLTLEQAHAALSAIITRSKARIPTFRTYANDYLRTHYNKSKDNDRRAVNAFIAFLGSKADEPLSAITAADCKDFIQWRLTDPAICTRPGTVARSRITLNAIFNKAVDAELLNRNPWRKAIVPKNSPYDIPENKRIALTPEQIATLINGMPDEWPDLIRLTVMTMGQRLGDMARLKWEQVDHAKNILHLRTGKTKANLDFPISYDMRALLARREAARIDEYIFPYSRIKHERSGKLSLEFHAYAVKLGILPPDTKKDLPGRIRTLSEISFHSTRKSAVTTGRQLGIAPDVMRSLVGHDSEEIQRAYFTPAAEYLAEQADKIQKTLLPPDTPPT